MEQIKKEELEKLEAELGWLWKEQHGSDAFGFLHAREKQILDMRVRDGKLYRDIGKELGLTTEWVKHLLRKGFENIRGITLASIETLERIKEIEVNRKEIDRKMEQLEKTVTELTKKYEIRGLPPAEVADIKINDIPGLSTRAKKTCHHQEIATIGDLLRYSKKDLLKFRNTGKITVDEIQTQLLKLYNIKVE